MTIHARVAEVTERIVARSHDARSRYLGRIDAAAEQAKTPRAKLGCANQAHAFAAAPANDKARLAVGRTPNLGIVTAYNDMLSAHQPYETYPELIRRAARAAGGHRAGGGRRAGHVRRRHPGRGRDGAVALLARRDRARHRGRPFASNLRCRRLPRHLRQDRAGPRDRRAVVRPPAGGLRAGGADDDGACRTPRRATSASSTRRARSAATTCLKPPRWAPTTGPGTCTFYGTANTNQMLMEVMGLHLPGAAFINPGHEAARRADRGGGAARACR